MEKINYGVIVMGKGGAQLMTDNPDVKNDVTRWVLALNNKSNVRLVGMGHTFKIEVEFYQSEGSICINSYLYGGDSDGPKTLESKTIKPEQDPLCESMFLLKRLEKNHPLYPASDSIKFTEFKDAIYEMK